MHNINYKMKIIIGTEKDVYGLFIVNKFLNELRLHEKNDVIILLTDTYNEEKTIYPLKEFLKMTKFFANDYMDMINNLNNNGKK